ncbi:MAG: hypothetical protein WB949_14940 [Candidatus Acidiferrales bacterium]
MTAQEEFWKWFIHREAELFLFDPVKEVERERIFDELAGALAKVDPNLTFEFGPNGISREFVISAGGIKSAFPAVVSLTKAAPALDRWKIIAFRPRRAPNIVELGNKRIDPSDVQFSLLDNGQIAGIHLFIPGFREDDIGFKQIGYLLLDEMLGEYDVGSRLGLIEMLSPQARTKGDRYPLAELPGLFDKLVSRLERRSGKPS